MQEKISQGYKQTGVGVIPEDWDVVPIGGLGEVRTGGTPPTNRRELYGGGYLFVSPADIGANKYINRTEKTLSLEGFRSSRIFPAGSSLFVCIGSTIGKVGLAAVDLCSNQQINSVFPGVNVDSEFLYYSLLHASPRIAALAGEQAVPIINKSAFSANLIALPGKDEQLAIAKALSDADARIEALEALLAKKRDLKQAAMQQFLTGKTRLPGFSGEWEVKPLGEIGEVSGAGVDKKVREGEQPVRLVNYMDAYRRTFIQSSDLDHWVTAPQHQARRCTVEKGDVFFTPSSETRDDIANSAVAMEDIPDAAYSYHVVRLRIKDHWDLQFRAYAFQTRDFLDQAQMICDGSGTRYVISLAKFRGMTVKVPEVKEQAAIAEILSDMDAELAALDAEAEKARTIKQGMMQNLLTGKVRLV